MSAGRRTNGAAIRAIRKSRGLKLVELSDRLARQGRASARSAHLCNIEVGRRDASDELLAAIALVLDVPLDAVQLPALVEVSRDPAA